jgi:hypothetical protein
MSSLPEGHHFYAWGDAEDREALLEAMSVTGLDEEIAVLRVRLRKHLETEKPDEGLVLAWINALARALLAKARIERVDPGKAQKQVAAVIRELGSIFLEDPPE